MKARVLPILVLAACLAMTGKASAAGGFDVVALGALGGIEDGNLSAWLIHPHDDERAVTCDAGTLVNGLRVAEEKGAFDDVKVPANQPLGRVGYVLSNRIKGYLLSHAHLDHVAGLIIASPDDSKKPIYSLASVGADVVEHYFNWRAWPNMTDQGKAPQLKKFAMEELRPGVATPLRDTKMTVVALPLSHGGIESTAFVIESDGDAILYFGDTGPDAVEKSTRMNDVWSIVAEKLKPRRLKAILIEVSYSNDRPDNLLFGHLTPKWLLKSLRELDEQAGGHALQDLPVVVTHIKYSLGREQPQKKVLEELAADNDLGVKFIIPEQGSRWHFE